MAGVNNTTVKNNGVAVIEGFLEALNTLQYKKMCTACISLSITLYTPCTSLTCIYNGHVVEFKKILSRERILKFYRTNAGCTHLNTLVSSGKTNRSEILAILSGNFIK